MNKSILAIAAAAMVLPTTAVFAEPFGNAPSWSYGSKQRAYDRGYEEGRRESQAVNSNTRVWRGKDGRNYCRRSDGTTGLLIGAAAGGVAGNVIAGRGDKTVGTIIGAAGGALLGRHVDRRNARCR
jgi:hypothetical protein